MRQLNATELNRKKRGQATVELALGMIFLVLLLVGVADVARIYSEHLAVVDAAGVAARWSTLAPTQKGCTYPAPYPNEAAVVAAEPGQLALAGGLSIIAQHGFAEALVFDQVIVCGGPG